MPCASLIEPRRAGIWMSASCCVTAARWSAPAFTMPSQAALAAPIAEEQEEDGEQESDAPLDELHRS